METKETRAKLVTAALTLTENTTIAPCPYERKLLDQFVRGVLSIEEVIELLEEREAIQGERHLFYLVLHLVQW